MRKLLIAPLAVVAVLAVASVAVATNVYTVHLGSTTVKGKGSKSKPIPTGQVGVGLVKNAAGPVIPGPGGERALSDSSPCNLRLRLYNDGDGMTLRLDSDGRPVPIDTSKAPSVRSNMCRAIVRHSSVVGVTRVRSPAAR